MFEDDTPKPGKIDLENMSVDELKHRIESLKEAIAACEAEIQKKEAHKSAADDFFKS